MVAACGSGGTEELLPRLATDGRTDVLRPAGAEHVAIEPPKGMRVVTVVVYAARPLSLPIQGVETFRHRAVVLLHSAVAAERFAEQCDAQEIDRSEVSLACLGQRIADAAGQAWREIAIAPRPEDAALLALAARMCQSGAVRVDANNTIG